MERDDLVIQPSCYMPGNTEPRQVVRRVNEGKPAEFRSLGVMME